MKNTILLLLLFMTTGVFSQTRLGFSEKEIINEFKDYPTKTYDSPRRHISVELHYGTFCYFFDENNICNYCSLKPSNHKYLQLLVYKYDEQYISKGGDVWETKEFPRIEIQLVYDKATRYCFFTYKLKPKNNEKN